MTNNTYHMIELPADATHDAARYSLSTPTPFADMTDADALALMTNTMLAMLPYLSANTIAISRSHFGDDDTDYMPAIANAFAALTFATATADYDPLESLHRLLASHDFIDDMLCLSADYDLRDNCINIDYTD